ncbi:hypothetical protein K435DRAFT_720157 [Dendrothele bispora CBS 962.96]|uniref:PH domain-containing protein n=1 Tax=Dendrothele bispora (strain CBS 962.96) TaxID=1314807 RepID=A0A4S8M9W2_DENBC|nr:hypothetical protein K435DRAFT_720157 [Dendrothele bispora CBS 962.96]
MSSSASVRKTSTSSGADSSSIAESLYQVKLLSALRSGDPALIHPFLAEIGKDKRKSLEGNESIDTGSAALHLAIRCGSVDTVRLLLSHRAISPNGAHPPGSGTTALHLAASLGRADVVNLLLEQENIDDTVRDSQGRSCKDVAKGRDVLRVIEDSRAFLNASYRSLLHSYIMSPPSSSPSPALVALLESPRVRFVNLSYLDDDHGTSLLHEAAKRKDLRLIELAVRAGADVFVRDKKGKMAYDGTGKDDRVRVFLRQFANHDTTLIQPSAPTEPPTTLKGYLNKYTNVAKGYNTRWFVLKNGILSYYRHQEDETVASRGSISMKTAILKTAAQGDRLRFEVHSTPSRGHSSVQKWYMKANHPVEAARWTQAINKSIDWYKREGGSPGTSTSGTEAEGGSITSRRSGESESTSGHGSSSVTPGFVSSVTPSKSSTVSIPSLHSARASISTLSIKRKSRHMASSSTQGSLGSSYVVYDGNDDGVSGASPKLGDMGDEMDDGNAADGEDGGDGGSYSSAEESTESATIPHRDSFDLHGNSTAAQMELTAQLLVNAKSELNGEFRDALKESFSMVQGMMNEYIQMSKDREDWYRKRLQVEKQRQKVWEESLATVVKEGETLENELRVRSRKRGSRFFDEGSAFRGDINATLKGMRPSMIAAKSPPLPEESSATPLQETFKTPTAQSPMEGLPVGSRPPMLPSSTQDTIVPTTSSLHDKFDDAESMVDTDEEDEFFDAIESNNLPNLVVAEELTSQTHTHDPSVPTDVALPYAGYKTLREKLALAAERPVTSLWSVLKHSIGKDLTKISFPVFFNEPTSMLQRMAEDMEFSECLDVAAREQDPHRRIAFVAAFAMSNYSSTIGRIAKPFNPMLSETFEYVHLDKEYRYVSEQVSHHPPMSACWAESPSWHYFGEVDAQNKFMGKSFEIRPTGIAHAELLIPEELAPNYPKATGTYSKGKVVEHYTWKKVTTNVSGFILGSPTIDHYGDMIVTNHRTKDTCILTFKPRGWRGKDAFEISGQVMDASGNVVYEIAGRWNSQLVARQVGAGSGVLNPDVSVGSPNSSVPTPEYILLWRNSEKIPGSPFNLTPFALTLNDCPKDTLKPYLCPTDCRLRPDQRAFELGYYELANDLKQSQEEKQRSTRKAREEGKVPPHRPRWFTAETDGDTGERVWTPSRINGTLEYWQEREKVWKEKQEKGPGQWKDVEPIFIEEPDVIR